MQDPVTQFRAGTAVRQKNGGSTARYPEKLRRLALQHLAAVQSRGGRVSRAARDLGVEPITLRSWQKQSSEGESVRGAVLKPVHLKTEGETAAVYNVVGPGDIRVECRGAEAVVALLRALS